MHNLKALVLLFLLATCSGYAMAQVASSDSAYIADATYRINKIYKLLDQQTEPPMNPRLVEEMNMLSAIEPKISDKSTLADIEQVQDAYDNKIKEMDEKKKIQDAITAKKQAEQDSIKTAKAEAQRKEEAEATAKEAKRHQTKILIIGIVVAVAMFVANQLIQRFRNLKTQRSIKEMQQNATHQAENKVKRKVEGEVRKQINQTTNSLQHKPKNGKRISI